MISITNEDDFSNFCTRLIPLGAKLEDSEERISISSVNGGKDYLEDMDGVNKYGVIELVVTWDDVHEPPILLKRGKDYLANENNITRKFSVNAVDLSLIGLNPNSYQVCNYYPIVNQLLGINETLRVVEKQFSIESPESATLTFGSLFDNVQDYQKSAIQNALEAKEIASVTNSQVSNNNTIIGNINTTVNNQQVQIDNNANVIGNQGATINIIQSNINNITNDLGIVSNNVTSLTGNVTRLETRVSAIETDLNTTNDRVDDVENKISRMAKRIMIEVF